MEAILKDLGFPEGELSVLFVDDSQITKINRQYLNRDRPTNVISFPMREGDFPGINPQLLGDVVISLERAKKEAAEKGNRMEDELNFLLIHGILHLLGYRHEDSEKEAEIMREKEETFMSIIDRIE